MRRYSALIALLALAGCAAAAAVESHDAQIPQTKDIPPMPKLKVVWKGDRRLRKLGNENFLKGHIYTLGERIYGYRTLIAQATAEMGLLANLTNWHHHALNLTRGQLEDVQSRYAEASLKQVLLTKATKLLNRELLRLQNQFNASKAIPLQKVENQIKHDLLSIGSSPRARSQLLATLALQKAMKRVTRLHRRFVQFLKYLSKRDGKVLSVSFAPLAGFNESVKRISEELKDLDNQIMKLRNKTSRILRRAILKRGHERAEAYAVRKLKRWIRDETRRLARAQKMLARTRDAIKNFK